MLEDAHPGGRIARSRAVLGALMVLVAAILLREGHGLTFHFDEWDFILRRRGHSLDTLLSPHNGHLSLGSVLIYKALLKAVGLTHYWVYRLVLVVLHLTCVILVFLLARRRVGEPGAVIAAGFILVLGAAAEDLVWAFQIGFLGSIAAGLGMLLALQGNERRHDVLAMILLATSLAFSGQGVPFLLAAMVIVAGDPRRRTRWWVIAVPLILYSAWYTKYGESQIHRDAIAPAGRYGVDLASSAVGGLFGLSIDYGRPLLLAGVVALLMVLARRAPTLSLAGAIAALGGLWVLTALSRSTLGEPTASRYIYPGAVLIVLTVVELLADRAPTRRVLAVLGGIVAFAALAGYGALHPFAAGLRGDGADLRARLAAVAIAADTAPFDYQPDPKLEPQVTAGPVLRAERDFGSIALTQAQLLNAPPTLRSAADEVLLAVEGPRLRRGGRCTGNARVANTDARLAPGATLTIRRPRAPVDVFVSRVGDPPATPTFIVPVGGDATIVTAADRYGQLPWHLRLGSASPPVAC